MKRGRRKCGNKEKVFGCDLMEHLTATSQEIPHVLRSCSVFIEKHGIVDGIYRLSGVSSNTQKLRSEFDCEGSPDLYKDVYLQDIHCVSSLCKAYFRELPNPLLTYQLYDHFAEAVAVQLEDERLVKIKEVLKELPPPHFRTLEYLMKHLIRMAAYSSETNMHVRNLAIVWAPNLLRSKDIEATGFNGTAAFMEVRVQSIVVEFILSHVNQLFPDLDPELAPPSERRKSLPSPSIISSQEDQFFKALPFQYPGNMSPGDGPPQMRPYHAIIDGTEKRKGSLKGRKWKSIFNLGGRLQDPRKKKYAPKEKEKNALRPAKSMDSLSTGPYTPEDSRRGSPHLSPLAMPPGVAEGGPAVASGYAVTYRRTGGASVSMVSGGGGAQGTYRSLDSGAGANGEKSQIPTPAMPSRAERRAGMHISGPFSVTVPLHITSGLALGVLQGGRAEEEEPKLGQDEEEKPKKDKHENAEEKETELDEGKVQTNSKTGSLIDDKEKINDGEKEVQREDKEQDEARHEKREESGDECQEDKCSTEDVSNETQQATDIPLLSEDIDGQDYMVMKGGVIHCPEEDECQYESLSNFQDDLTLDFQDTFGFLDMMDMPTSNQLNEFSVEPPAHEIEDDEEEDKQSPLQSHSHYIETSQLNLPVQTSRAISNKSQSLPYKAGLFLPVMSLSSEEDSYGPSDDDVDDDDESSDSGKGEYEDMFIKSLPSSHFYELNWSKPPTIILDSESNVDSHSKSQSECLIQSHAMGENVQDPPSASHLNDTEIIVSNAVYHCSNDSDFSSLPLVTDGENDGEDRSGIKEIGTVKTPIHEENINLEITDETPACSHNDSQFAEDENEEDTYFGPDPPSTTVEASNSETLEPTVDMTVINEDPSGSDDQQESTDNYIDNSKSENITDMTSPDVEKTQMETVVVHTHMQEELDGNELEGLVVGEDREVGEGVEEQRDERETKEETIIKEESMESEDSEGWENDDCPIDQVDEVQLEKENDMVPQEEQILDVENKGEEFDVEKQKEDSDREEEDDQQTEEDDVEEEIEAQKDCYLEDVAELKKGSVPEELIEEDDRLSVDGEERQIENEKENLREEKLENPSRLDREKPVRPPRMKDREEGGSAALGLGVGRTVIISKQKIYQVKAVPVVPPKPQHSKITAFRQQFQQRDIERQHKSIQPTWAERQHTDKEIPKKESENAENRHADLADVAQNHDYNYTEQEKETGNDRETTEENQADPLKKIHLQDTMSSNSSEGEIEQDREEQKQRDLEKGRGNLDGVSLRKDRQKELDKEAKRSSGISMCFDEAVARATGKRYREKESIDKDKFVDQCERNEQKEGPNQRKPVEEEQKTD
ncbi:rho GTPase-activating protein 30 [Silurus meridionalis]|uniref:Rho-GAP domain-containing protein n=1 Tax=Silurus meridionalis TaxID=175797 RepID=A0A8T0AIW9_SILME|nr:rho GTPase-activating protein 30 [Silurus meridionalis]KAF7692482.1 hypothetical protein HF521_010092 [Silurus meridionalis]